MKTAYVTATVVSLACMGCQNTGPKVESLTPEQVVDSINGKGIPTWLGDKDSRDQLRSTLRPIEEKCSQQGGVLSVTQYQRVLFTSKRDPSRHFVLPEQLACVAGTDNLLWGAELRLANTNYYISRSTNAGAMLFGEIQSKFVSSGTLNGRLIAQSRDSRVKREECNRERSDFVRKVRETPEIGMKVADGVIIEVRKPLVLVQYDDRGRTTRGRTEEWLDAQSLEPAYGSLPACNQYRTGN